jgi:hypothetical protein
VQCRRGVRRGRCGGAKRRHVSGQAKKLDSPLVKGECVVGVAIPTAGAGAAKGFVSSRQETRESKGASGVVDEVLGVRGKPTTGVGVNGRAGFVCR